MPSLTSATRHLNFFRVHLLLFVIVPLLASLIFYWLNDARDGNDQFVSYIDSLFLCVSAATVAGLFPVTLSNIEVGQQIILAILTAIGSYSFVSTAMVVIRRHYFSKQMEVKLARDIEQIITSRAPSEAPEKKSQPHSTQGSQTSEERKVLSPLNDDALTSGESNPVRPSMERQQQSIAFISEPQSIGGQAENTHLRRRAGVPLQNHETMNSAHGVLRRGVKLQRSNTTTTLRDRGYGGFPTPWVALRALVARVFYRSPTSITRKLTGRFSVPRTQTLQSVHDQSHVIGQSNPYIKVVPYFTFNATVGKNSAFEDLTQEEREELGGVELCALNMLAWVVPAYWLGVQLLGFVVLAPYMARAEFRGALTTEAGQASPVNPTWFALFQVLSSYGNNGILVDASLVPFQKAYLLLWVMIILILAGNTAFPCFLRFFLWVGSKCVRQSSQSYATLRFILDHPRRCFLYLFPSLQTWYLLFIIIALNFIDWILFLVLDIGNEPIQSIPTGVRVMAGLFQAVAVRCGGFQIVGLGSLAPAVQVLYVVMMYLGGLPLALGVRSTNVYEDRSIAVFDQEVGEDDEPILHMRPGLSEAAKWGEYLTWHLKRQLSFDLWWLAIALVLICVFERGKILDPSKSSYINVFSILFEIVSGYGTVGLSLGVTNQNYSMSGALGTASKLVLCAVMLRGRHRGLPAAIDRSVLLPSELGRQAEMEKEFRIREAVVRAALRDAAARVGVEDPRVHDFEEDTPPGLA